MIEIQDLSKHFGSLKAVDGITFSVRPGEVLGFLGPNGAGKSTTMKMITGFLAPTAGRIRVCGHDVQKEPIPAKRRMGYLPEGAPLYPDMTPLGLLRFIAEIRAIPKAEREQRIRDAIEKVHIERVLHQRIDTLSKGFKRRVGIAQAILHDPEVLILDEPTDGLDPNQKHEVRTLISQMSKDKVIVLSTHILEEVEAVCTRAIIISEGKLLFDGRPDELQARSPRHNAVALTVRVEAASEARERLGGLSSVAKVDLVHAENGHAQFLLYPRNGASILGELSTLTHTAGWEVDDLRVEKGRLDEVFRMITGEAVRN